MIRMSRRTLIERTTAAMVAIPFVAIATVTGCERSAPSGGSTPRYVVLSPALAVTLRDLGHEDRIVARHAHDLVLDESLPVAGELGRLDYEVILAAQPTHVLIEWGDPAQPLPERLVDLSRDRGFEVMRFSMLTLADIKDAVDRLENELPPAERGPDEGTWQARMDSLWFSPEAGDPGRSARAAAGRVLLIATTDPTIGVLGPGSWHHQIVEAVGGVPAITVGAPWMELSPEDVLRLAPDAIILIQPRSRDQGAGEIEREPADAREALGVLARLDIPAVRTGHVALLDDPLAHTPSTAMVALTLRVEAILSGWGGASATGDDTPR